MDEQEKSLRKIIADKLRVLRAQKRISQDTLAEASNLSQVSIYKLENEMVTPSVYVMLRLAEALQVTVNDLIY